MQITFTGLDGEILLERLDVITIVSQFTGSLYEERSIGTVGGEISRFTDGKQMRENSSSEAVVAGMELIGVPHCHKAKEYSNTE